MSTTENEKTPTLTPENCYLVAASWLKNENIEMAREWRMLGDSIKLTDWRS